MDVNSIIGRYKMVDNKSKDDITTSKREAEKLTATTVLEDDKSIQARTTLSEQHQSIDRALDETKDNIKRTLEEARREIPRNTQVINDYQEHSLQTTREITDNYVESQKEIVKLYQSTWVPYVESVYGWASPLWAAEIYSRTVNNFADNVIAATRIANNAIFATVKAFMTFVEHEKGDLKEFSRIGVNTARTVAQASRDVAREHDVSSNRHY